MADQFSSGNAEPEGRTSRRVEDSLNRDSSSLAEAKRAPGRARSSCGCGNAGESAAGKSVSFRTTTAEAVSCARTGFTRKERFDEQKTRTGARNLGVFIARSMFLEFRFRRHFIARRAPHPHTSARFSLGAKLCHHPARLKSAAGLRRIKKNRRKANVSDKCQTFP